MHFIIIIIIIIIASYLVNRHHLYNHTSSYNIYHNDTNNSLIYSFLTVHSDVQSHIQNKMLYFTSVMLKP